MRAACTPIRCGGGSQRAEADPARWDIPWVGLHPLSRVKEVAQFDLENDSLCEPTQEVLEREIREAVSDRSGGVRSRSSRCIRSSTPVRTDSDWESPASWPQRAGRRLAPPNGSAEFLGQRDDDAFGAAE